MQSWELQDIKNRLSEIIDSIKQAPQQITASGKPVAIVVSADQYEASEKAQLSLADFMQHSPLFDLEELTLTREGGFC